MNMTSVYPVLALLCYAIALCHGENKIQLVQELFRHGDRAPEQTFPNDVHKDYWSGPGQLTNTGKLQHYTLGGLVRKHYGDFLSESYKWQEIHIRSTDVDRTLMSAYSHLAGLYPPTQEDKFTPNLDWQPIPVHTVENAFDYLLNPATECPLAMALFEEYLKTPEVREYLGPRMPTYEYACEQAGFPKISDPVQILLKAFGLRDVFTCQKSHDLSWPEWLTDEVWQALDDLAELEFRAFFGSKVQGKFRGGPLLQEMRENMKKKIDGTMEPEERKLFMYSGHDATITAFLGALTIYNHILPPYASAVFVELLQDDVSNEYSVQILYRNDTSVPPYPMPLEGCDAVCPWEDFLRLTDDLIPEDWKLECDKSLLENYLREDDGSKRQSGSASDEL